MIFALGTTVFFYLDALFIPIDATVVLGIIGGGIAIVVAVPAFRSDNVYQVWVLPDDACRSFRIDLNHDFGQTPDVFRDRSTMKPAIILLAITGLIPPLRKVGPTQHDWKLLGFEGLLLLLLLLLDTL
jgi:hypothetical protein